MIFDICEENKNKTGIYCITNIVDNKKYIGQTTESFYDRYLRHSNLLKNQKHSNSHLQSAYNKYGPDNFVMTIVEICSDFDKIASLEEKYIAKYREKYECYNFLSGGPTMCGTNNPFYGKKHSEEALQKMSERRKNKYCGSDNNFYGANHSGENNGFYGHKHTEESRKKMSIAKLEMYKGKNNPFYGKKQKSENIENLRKIVMSMEHTKVICIETNITYHSIAEASRQTGASAKQISAVCAGHGITAGKLHWQYA